MDNWMARRMDCWIDRWINRWMGRWIELVCKHIWLESSIQHTVLYEYLYEQPPNPSVKSHITYYVVVGTSSIALEV